jgi:hypothetical protein
MIFRRRVSSPVVMPSDGQGFECVAGVSCAYVATPQIGFICKVSLCRDYSVSRSKEQNHCLPV